MRMRTFTTLNKVQRITGKRRIPRPAPRRLHRYSQSSRARHRRAAVDSMLSIRLRRSARQLILVWAMRRRWRLARNIPRPGSQAWLRQVAGTKAAHRIRAVYLLATFNPDSWVPARPVRSKAGVCGLAV